MSLWADLLKSLQPAPLVTAPAGNTVPQPAPRPPQVLPIGGTGELTDPNAGGTSHPPVKIQGDPNVAVFPVLQSLPIEHYTDPTNHPAPLMSGVPGIGDQEPARDPISLSDLGDQRSAQLQSIANAAAKLPPQLPPFPGDASLHMLFGPRVNNPGSVEPVGVPNYRQTVDQAHMPLEHVHRLSDGEPSPAKPTVAIPVGSGQTDNPILLAPVGGERFTPDPFPQSQTQGAAQPKKNATKFIPPEQRLVNRKAAESANTTGLVALAAALVVAFLVIRS